MLQEARKSINGITYDPVHESSKFHFSIEGARVRRSQPFQSIVTLLGRSTGAAQGLVAQFHA